MSNLNSQISTYLRTTITGGLGTQQNQPQQFFKQLDVENSDNL
ncbi:hypothetical protein [Dendronalium sp. ChiSLP03b]|nr:hypothetical protein [Dendronalium sp. ChiSLP03b]